MQSLLLHTGKMWLDQDDFEKLFDAISRVTFDKLDRRKIKEIKSVAGTSEEKVVLQAPVMAQGNIEESW